MPLDYTVAVFDLDNCLMDARAVGPLFEPAFEAVRQANQGALSPQALDQALQACWFTAFDLVAQRHHFEQILAREGCTPRQMLVVGDNPLSELAAGRALGATTVQTVRPGVEPWPLADHRVDGLQGLLALRSADAPRAVADMPQAGADQGI